MSGAAIEGVCRVPWTPSRAIITASSQGHALRKLMCCQRLLLTAAFAIRKFASAATCFTPGSCFMIRFIRATGRTWAGMEGRGGVRSHDYWHALLLQLLSFVLVVVLRAPLERRLPGSLVLH